jgi:hypothetical protein
VSPFGGTDRPFAVRTEVKYFKLNDFLHIDAGEQHFVKMDPELIEPERGY